MKTKANQYFLCCNKIFVGHCFFRFGGCYRSRFVCLWFSWSAFRFFVQLVDPRAPNLALKSFFTLLFIWAFLTWSGFVLVRSSFPFKIVASGKQHSVFLFHNLCWVKQRYFVHIPRSCTLITENKYSGHGMILAYLIITVKWVVFTCVVCFESLAPFWDPRWKAWDCHFFLNWLTVKMH